MSRPAKAPTDKSANKQADEARTEWMTIRGDFWDVSEVGGIALCRTGLGLWFDVGTAKSIRIAASDTFDEFSYELFRVDEWGADVDTRNGVERDTHPLHHACDPPPNSTPKSTPPLTHALHTSRPHLPQRIRFPLSILHSSHLAMIVSPFSVCRPV